MMTNTVVDPAVDVPGHTYAEPLAGLRVSWGSILAGAVAALSASLILWSLSLAVILSVTHTSALRGTLVAMGICSIATTLIGAAIGGWLAGYLPGNASRLIAGVHAFLAWGLTFLVASLLQLSLLAGATRTTTEAAVSTAGAAAQTAGSTVGGAAGGQMSLDSNAQNLLKSLGYSEREANQMVNQSKTQVQHMLHGRSGPSVTGGDVQGALDNVFHFVAGLSWAWFGTWMLAAFVSIAGGLIGARRLIGTGRPGRPVQTIEVPTTRAAPPPLTRTPETA